MARFIVVPQWQGSPSTRAMSLIDGANTIAGDLPHAACHGVDVPVEAGESLGTGVQRASTLQRVAAHLREELSAFDDDERLIVIGGDCGVAVPSIAHAASTLGGDLAVVWFDAHGDLHSPTSSPSGAFAGMALQAALGGAPDSLSIPPGTITADRVVLAGARDLDVAEQLAATETGIRMLSVAEIPGSLADAVAETGAARVYIHVDLDVIDPAAMEGVSSPQPFGIDPADLVAAIGAVRERLPLAGASIAGFAPRSADDAVGDMGTILRVIGALAKS